MSAYWPAIVGFFMGFGFGVGCALAVMYSIFMGGYRAAVKDAAGPLQPKRYTDAIEKLRAAFRK